MDLRFPDEGLQWLLQILDSPAIRSSKRRPLALIHAAFLAPWVGEPDLGVMLATQGVNMLRAANRRSATYSLGLQMLAMAWASEGSPESWEQALAAAKEAREIDVSVNELQRAIHSTNVADVLLVHDDLDEAESLFKITISILEGRGEAWLRAAPEDVPRRARTCARSTPRERSPRRARRLAG